MFDQKFSKLNLQMCPVCEKEKEIFYICDNCGSNFCIDCLDKKNPVRFECRRCKSTNVQILYPELYVLPNYKKNLICQYCGSNEYIEISSNKKVCPNCQSTHVFNIFEKKSQLEQDFIELIKNSRSFISPLEDLMIRLNKIKKKVKDNPKIIHLNVRSNLIINFKIFNFIKKILFDKILIYFHYLNLNKQIFFSIFTRPNTDIKFINSILGSLQINYESVQKDIIRNVSNLNENLDRIEEDFQSKIVHKLYQEIQDLLTINEILVFLTDATLKTGSTSKATKNINGTLLITSLNIIFTNEDQILVFKAPVEDLRMIRDNPKKKKIFIEFYDRYCEFLLKEKNSTKVLESILLARSPGQELKFNKEKEGILKEKDLYINDLSNYIENSINNLLISRKDIITSEIQKSKVYSTLGTDLDSSKLFIFVLMPFREDLRKIYTEYIKTPLEEEGYLVKRADDFHNSVPILYNILESISKADIIIADLTDKNPNVFYEVGRAHEQKGKYVIQICQQKDKLPFDLGHIRTIFYNDHQEGLLILKEQILRYVDTYIREFKNDNTIINHDKIDSNS